MNSNNNKFLSTIVKSGFVVVLFIMLSSCGSSKNAISSNNSNSITNLPNGAALGKCSIDMSNQSDFGMKLQAYEALGSGLRSDLIRIQFIRFPSEFSSSDASAIQLWTRTIDQSGNWGAWQNVRFYFEHRSANGQTRMTPYSYQDITWKDLKQVALSFGLTVSSASDFFRQIQLVAQLDSNAKTITAALYQNGQNQAKYITALAPIFDANPISYQQNHPKALVDLHPLQNLMNTNFTNSQFEFELNKFCF